IVVIYCQTQQSFDVATDGSVLPLVSTILTINDDGNVPEKPTMDQPTNQQMLVASGGDDHEWAVVSRPPCMSGFDSKGDGMVDLEMNRVVTMKKTDQ
ncbi:hypothetical protein A2U01_0034569, partial [Trifolium medium]|nr:hypothetical protein [Trifolium medium]